MQMRDGDGLRTDELVARLRGAVDPPGPPPPAVDPVTGQRGAAVLILADPATAGVPLLMMRRSRIVRTFRGQIAFPGGSADDGDAFPVGTALREAREELGIDPALVEVLGVLAPVSTRTRMRRVDAVVAVQRGPLTPRPDGHEVGEHFRLRLDELLLAPVTSRGIPGFEEPVHFIEIGPRIVWGATAAMLVQLMRRLGRGL